MVDINSVATDPTMDPTVRSSSLSLFPLLSCLASLFANFLKHSMNSNKARNASLRELAPSRYLFSPFPSLLTKIRTQGQGNTIFDFFKMSSTGLASVRQQFLRAASILSFLFPPQAVPDGLWRRACFNVRVAQPRLKHVVNFFSLFFIVCLFSILLTSC